MSTSVQGVEELRKEVCLLKTQVELLYDELRQLKKRVKVSQSFLVHVYNFVLFLIRDACEKILVLQHNVFCNVATV